MNINIKTSQLELTPAIKTYINDKMNMLGKYFGKSIKVINIDFEVDKTIGDQRNGEIFRAEANIEVPGKLLRVEKTEMDLYKAIDKVKDHMEIVIKRHKDRLQDRKKRNGARELKSVV